MGILLLGRSSTVLSAFNGGRSQTAMNFLGYGNEYPFINVMKNNQGWSGTADQLDPRNYDENGYPISLTGDIISVMYVPNQARRPGRWAVTWDSTGTSTIVVQGFALSGATGSKTTSGPTGRYEFLPDAGVVLFTIGISGADVSNRVTNLQVFHTDDETDLNNGEVYNRDFVNKLKEMNPGVLRFGDWLPMNTCDISTWATRKPVGYVTYAGVGEMRSSICAGMTSGGTGDDYEISFDDPISGNGAPVDKQKIILRFDRSSVGTTPTLNLNGTGPIRITQGTSSSITGFTSRRPVVDRWATMTFDADLNVWIKRGGDASEFSFFLENGCPHEIFLRLCKQVGAHPWWNMPKFACDPITDYVAGLANMMLSQGEPWMIPRLEGPNETWNTSGFGFQASFYANNKQCVWNGGPRVNETNIPFPVTGISWTGSGATGTSTLTVTGALPPLGARVTLAGSGWTGMSGITGQDVYIVARDVGAGTVQINRAPSAGTSPVTGLSTSFSANAADLANWYGRVMSLVGQAMNSVYGGDPLTQTKYQVMCGVHTSGSAANTYARMGSTSYSISQGINNNPDLSVCAYNWITHIAVATYITPTAYSYIPEMLMAYRYAGGDLTAADDYCDSLNNNSGGLFNLAGTKALITAKFDAAQNWGGVSGYAQAPFAPGGGTRNLKMGAYEGGYSPDFRSEAVTSVVTAATKGSTTFVTLPVTIIQHSNYTRSGVALDAAAVAVGAQLSFTGWPTGWTALNSGLYTVLSVNTSTNVVEIQFDSSAIVEAFSGAPVATYIGPPTSAICGPNATATRMLNELRNAGRYSTHLRGYTYGGYLGSQSNYQNFLDAGGEFPSQFFFCAPSSHPSGTQPVGTGTCWGMLTNIYNDPPSASWDAIVEFNN